MKPKTAKSMSHIPMEVLHDKAEPLPSQFEIIVPHCDVKNYYVILAHPTKNISGVRAFMNAKGGKYEWSKPRIFERDSAIWHCFVYWNKESVRKLFQLEKIEYAVALIQTETDADKIDKILSRISKPSQEILNALIYAADADKYRRVFDYHGKTYFIVRKPIKDGDIFRFKKEVDTLHLSPFLQGYCCSTETAPMRLGTLRLMFPYLF